MTDNARWSLTLPWPGKTLNPNSRAHWRTLAAAKKKYRADCYLIAKNNPKPGTARLIVSFYPPDKRLRDDDNIIASFKAGRDGLADAWEIDDREFRFTYRIDEAVKYGAVVLTT